jgi:WD40 repeat protein
VALGTQDGGIQIWDAEAPLGDELEATMDGHDTILFLLAFSPDGRQLASASRDGTARVWDVATGDELVVLPHGAQVRSVVFHPDGDRILTGDWEGNARVWDVTPQGASERLTLPAHNEIRAAAFSPDGQFLLTGGWDGLAKIWDPASGELIHTLQGHAAFVGAAAYSPDGRRVATGDEEGTVRIWDAQTGQVLATLTGHAAGDVGGVFTGVMDIAFSPNGERLATAGADGTLRFWDVNGGDELLLLRASGGLASLAISPDGRFLATGIDNPGGTVIVRDAATGAALALSPLSHGAQVFGLAFSPDGRLLATSGGDTNVKVWALDDESGRAELLLTLESHASSVMRVRFSPDGRLLASATRSELRVWDVSNLTTGTGDGITPELLLLPGGPGLAFSPDGRELVSGGLDGLAHFYLMDTEAVIALARSRLTRGWTERECQQYLHVTACPARLSG